MQGGGGHSHIANRAFQQYKSFNGKKEIMSPRGNVSLGCAVSGIMLIAATPRGLRPTSQGQLDVIAQGSRVSHVIQHWFCDVESHIIPRW